MVAYAILSSRSRFLSKLEKVNSMSVKEHPPVLELAATSVSAVAAAAIAVAADDRRRPKRLNRVSPELVPLLREPAAAKLSAPLLGEMNVPSYDDDLAPARGIGIGLVLSVPVWAIISGLVWAMFR